jgi:aspartate ammonia-lyase
MEMRTEKDSLGEKQVPADAYYGIQTQRAVENFPITGLKPFPQLVEATVLIKKAAAETNRDLGRLKPDVAEKIVAAADEVLGGKLRDQFVVDPIQAGAGTSHNMNTNEVLANRASEMLGEPRGAYTTVHPNDHVNMAQSTNDVFPTAMRIASLLALKKLYPVLDAAIAALDAKAVEFDGIVKSGRTHLQDAVPIRLGQEFGAYATAVSKAKDGIEEAAQRVKVLGIGGTAVGTGLNAGPLYPRKVVEYLNKYTGFGLSSNLNLIHAMQDQTPVLDLSAAMRTLAVTCIRIANDFRLLSSGPMTGLAEIQLPPVQPGSSIMPGKINPSMAEMLNQACFQVIGNDTAVMMGAQAGQIDLNVMMPGMAFAILFSIRIMTNALDVFTRFCIQGITANAERCLMYAHKSATVATALNPYIGYAKAAELVKEALKTGKTIIELAEEKGYMSREELEKVLDLRKLTEA